MILSIAIFVIWVIMLMVSPSLEIVLGLVILGRKYLPKKSSTYCWKTGGVYNVANHYKTFCIEALIINMK